jgi:predicted transcriptional regulator YdeE
MEQIQVCDVKQAAMETEFETFSELMREKESLLDEDLDKLDVCTKRQSLESEFEAYSVVLEERKSHISEEMVHQKVLATTLEMASRFEPFTELMEGEETLLQKSLEQLNLDTKTEPANNTSLVNGVPEEAELTGLSVSQVSPLLLETLEAGSDTSEVVNEGETPSSSILEDISHQPVELSNEATTEESLTLSESSELNLSGLDILEGHVGTAIARASETFSMGSGKKGTILTDGDINSQGYNRESNTDSEAKTDSETSMSHSDEKVSTPLDGNLARTEDSTK